MPAQIPNHLRSLIPMLTCLDAAAEIDFLISAFGAVERSRRTAPDGAVVHATLSIADKLLMAHGEFPGIASRAPRSDGSSSVVTYLYFDDADAALQQALAAGAKVLIPIQDAFWGDRVVRIVDPQGHVWNIASRISHAAK